MKKINMNAAPPFDVEIVLKMENHMDSAARHCVPPQGKKSDYLPHRYTALRRCLAKVRSQMAAVEAKNKKKASTE